MQYVSTGLIVLLVAMISSVVGGVCLCAYFYKEGKRKSQVRPVDQPIAKMAEPFDTKKLWERGRKKPALTLTKSESVKSISINGVIAKGPASDVGDEEATIGEVGDGGINPGSTPAPVPELQPPTSEKAPSDATPAVEVS